MTALKKLRTEQGLTLEAVGLAMGVTRQCVQMWEAGRRWPSSADLPKLAKVLGCTIDDLFREETAAQDEINMEGTA